MTWKTISNNKVPRWVLRKRRAHVRGRTYLYKKRGNKWQKRLKGEWDNKIKPWQYVLVGFISALAAALISGIILYWFFRSDLQ